MLLPDTRGEQWVGGERGAEQELSGELSLQELFEGREGHSTFREQEFRVWTVVPSLQDDAHVRNAAEEGEMGSNKTGPIRGSGASWYSVG